VFRVGERILYRQKGLLSTGELYLGEIKEVGDEFLKMEIEVEGGGKEVKMIAKSQIVIERKV
jgi:hypothetical protein